MRGDIRALAEQILALSLMRYDDAYGTTRLPITTHEAHRLASWQRPLSEEEAVDDDEWF